MSKFSVELKIGGNWNNGVTYVQQATIIVDGRTLKEVEEKAITMYCDDIIKQYGGANNLEVIYENYDKTTEATCNTCGKCVCEWSITARARRMKKDESYKYARNYSGVRYCYNGFYKGYTSENICYVAYDPEYNKAEPKAEETEATEITETQTTEATEITETQTTETQQKEGSIMKNYEVKAIIETGEECVDIIPDDSEIMADSVEEAVDCVISDLMEQATFSDYNAERYDNYKFVIYDQNNNVICVYRFKARLTFDNKEIEGAEWENPEYCGTVTDTTEETKKDIVKKYEAEGLTEAGQWVLLFNDLIDNAETDTDALRVARERMLKKGLDVSVRVRAYYYNRITGEGGYSHSWTEQPKAEATTQTTEETTEATTQTTEETYNPDTTTTYNPDTTTTYNPDTTTTYNPDTTTTYNPDTTTTYNPDTTTTYNPDTTTTAQPAEETGQTTETTAETTETTAQTTPPTEATGKEVTGVTIREYRTYNNGDKVMIKHNCFYNADEIIDNYHATDPSYICKYKGLMFGKDDNDYYVSEFHYEEQYL